MAVDYIERASAAVERFAGGPGTSLIATFTNATAGDVFACFVGVRGVQESVTPPDGWITIGPFDRADNGALPSRMYGFVGAYDGADNTPTFTIGGVASRVVLDGAIYRGVNTSAMVADYQEIDQAGSTTLVTPGVLTSADDSDIYLGMFGVWSTTNKAFGNPTNWTLIRENGWNTGEYNMRTWYRNIVEAGVVADASSTVTAGMDSQWGLMIALNPIGVGGSSRRPRANRGLRRYIGR